MVNLATNNDLPAIEELWKLGFGDELEYIHFVEKHLLTPEKILVYRTEQDGVVGMLCMEPFHLLGFGKTYTANYLYAFTIHPQFRGQQLGEKLLQGFHNYCKHQGFQASVLKPANPQLFAYYEKQGYHTRFVIEELRINPEFLLPTGQHCILVPRALEQLESERARFFEPYGLYAAWPASYLCFVQKEAKLRGGGVVRVHCAGQEGYLVYRLEEEVAEIIECAIPRAVLDDALFALHQRTQAKQYRLRLVSGYMEGEVQKPLPFAMIRWYDRVQREILPEEGYISFVMD